MIADFCGEVLAAGLLALANSWETLGVSIELWADYVFVEGDLVYARVTERITVVMQRIQGLIPRAMHSISRMQAAGSKAIEDLGDAMHRAGYAATAVSSGKGSVDSYNQGRQAVPNINDGSLVN
jgi:hypothetical protein